MTYRIVIVIVICGFVCRRILNCIFSYRWLDKIKNSSMRDKAFVSARSLSIYFRGDERCVLSVRTEMSGGGKEGEDVQRIVCSEGERVARLCPRTSVFLHTVIPFLRQWFHFITSWSVIQISTRATCYSWRGKFTYGLYVVELAHVSPVVLLITGQTAARYTRKLRRFLT
jgi:hypothetical protein